MAPSFPFNKQTADPRELLYISDLDGTLLQRDGTIPQRSIDRLNRLIDKGLQFSIATARNYDSAHPILKGLNLKLPVILFNGVYLTDFHSGHNVLQSKFIAREVIDDLLTLVSPLNMDPFIYTYGDNHQVYCRHARNAGARAYLESLNGDKRLLKVGEYDIPGSERVSGFLLIDTHDALHPVYSSLRKQYSGHLSLYFAADVSMQGYYWLQSFHRDANKGNMLQKLAAHLHRPLDRIVVFGDYLNDLDMFSVAGRSIAVANALPEVKSAAHQVIGSNEDGAVIDYLESLGWE